VSLFDGITVWRCFVAGKGKKQFTADDERNVVRFLMREEPEIIKGIKGIVDSPQDLTSKFTAKEIASAINLDPKVVQKIFCALERKVQNKVNDNHGAEVEVKTVLTGENAGKEYKVKIPNIRVSLDTADGRAGRSAGSIDDLFDSIDELEEMFA